MGILIVLTLALSDLVIREIHQTQDAVASGKAYFAAEAAVENALLDLHENLPGFELADNTNKDCQPQADTDFRFCYGIHNTADKFPYFEPGKALFLDPNNPGRAISSTALYDIDPQKTYNVLGLNQSVVIPLSTDLKGQPNDVHEFLVEYYFDPSIYKKLPIDAVNGFDVLRWKLFGYPQKVPGDPLSIDTSKTDAISDLYPVLFGSNEFHPTCIGNDPNALLFTLFPCSPPAPKDKASLGLEYWGAARECNLSDVGPNVDLKYCKISDFIKSHAQNYLVLTNVVNPNIVGVNDPTNPDATDLALTNIYYRLVTHDPKNVPGAPQLVREEAQINADGFALNGKVIQSIDVKIGLRSFLPVFHFSLYRTDATKEVIPAFNRVRGLPFSL